MSARALEPIALLLVPVLALAAATGIAVPGAAHSCEECEPTGCEEGEDHRHQRVDRISGDREYCESWREEDHPAGEDCVVVVEAPDEVCELIDRVLEKLTSDAKSTRRAA